MSGIFVQKVFILLRKYTLRFLWVGGRPCLCEVCGLEVWNLRGHQAAEHFLSGGHVDSAASTGRRFVCSVGNCSVRFEKKTELRRHLSFAHGLGKNILNIVTVIVCMYTGFLF